MFLHLFIYSMIGKNNDHIIKYHSKQSKEEDVPNLPMRSLIIGPIRKWQNIFIK